MRVLCGILGLLALGLVSGTAVAGLSGAVAPGAITGTLSVSTPVPTVTVSLPVTTVTTPTTVPTVPVTVTVPVTTAVTVPTTTAATTTAPPPVTTSVPSVTTAVTNVATTTPRVTTTVPPVTAPVPLPVTPTSSTTPGVSDSEPTATTAAAPALPGARAATEPAPRRDSNAAARGTWSSGGAISTGFATTERRAIVLRFRLDGPRPIRIRVVRGAPVCRVVGSFWIRGRMGSNTLRFDGTLGKLRLRPGTYELQVRAPGALSRRVWVRISDAGRLSIVKTHTTCVTPLETAGILGATWPPQSPTGNESSGPRAGVASARFFRTGSDEGGFTPNSLASELPRNPLGVLLLGLAFLLVAIAAIPREAIPARRLGALVADRRLELVSAAATVFVTAVMTLALA